MINTALLSQTQEGGVSLGNTNLYYRKYGGDEVQDVCEGREIRKGHNIGAQIIDDNIWIITANPKISGKALVFLNNTQQKILSTLQNIYYT